MATLSLKDISKEIRDIDFGMLTTLSEGGRFASRPMSNNGDVEYDGDSHFFAYDDTRTVADIQRDSNVGLTFAGAKSLLGKPGIFIAIEGTAELIRDKVQFEAHWNSDLEAWFPEGVDTPGLILIKVHADRLHYWDDKEEGELTSFV